MGMRIGRKIIGCREEDESEGLIWRSWGRGDISFVYLFFD